MKSRQDLYYLVAGALGLIAALIGAIGAPRLAIGSDAAAVVNGAPIPREALARAILALESDSRNPITPEREAAVLERLIEEEVLVQHGVELGLAETDFAARRALVQSVLALAAAERAGAEAGEPELRRFYRENAGFFAPPPRFAASVVFLRDGAPAARIEAARTGLEQGADARTLGDPMAIPLPRAALAEAEWRRLIGADAASAAALLAPAQITQPVQTSGGIFLIRMDGFVAAPAPTFEDVAPQVRAEYQRRADEQSVRAYIDRLKRAARIERRLGAQKL
jgi:parvulin-like peptidyl-prolyl isomerase